MTALGASLSACGSATGPHAHVALAATSTVTASGGTLGYAMQVAVTVTNQGSTAIPYQGNTCGAVTYQLVPVTGGTGAMPVWRYPGAVCLAYSVSALLQPGQSVTMTAYYPTGNPDIDGAPPAAGTYRVKATVGFADAMRTVDAGTVTIGE
jgi:hypothetical protein